MEDPDACDAGAADVPGVTGRGSSGIIDEDASFDLMMCSDKEAAATLVSRLEAALPAESLNFSGNCCLAAVSDAFWSKAG